MGKETIDRAVAYVESCRSQKDNQGFAGFGYQPNVEQTGRALKGIMAAYAGSSIVAALLVLVCLHFYRLTRGWQERLPTGAAA